MDFPCNIHGETLGIQRESCASIKFGELALSIYIIGISEVLIWRSEFLAPWIWVRVQ